MNKLQIFMAVNHGYLTLPRLAELIELDRLCPILVRCGQCRFTCGAQDVEHLLRCIELGGDYVRDVSFPAGSLERAAAWIDPNAAPLCNHCGVNPRLEGAWFCPECLKRHDNLARHVPSTSQGDEQERRHWPAGDHGEEWRGDNDGL